MKNLPEKIYLNLNMTPQEVVETKDKDFHEATKTWEITWSEECLSEHDPEYVRKDALIEKPAWSEEDEAHINGIMDYLLDYKLLANEEDLNVANGVQEEINWLKSLKDRVQPKQEWGEDDDLILETIIEHIIPDKPFIANGFTDEELVTWLKTLRTQNTWKPSDEQIKALEHFIVYHNGSTNYAKDLEELRLQLKKLKG